ncbi:MAG: hypothetical protein AABY10_01075 [Nanoarchaeota archaeon]
MNQKTKIWLVPFGSLIGGIGIGKINENLNLGFSLALIGLILIFIGRQTYIKVLKNLK